jgi:hypothetical protein
VKNDDETEDFEVLTLKNIHEKAKRSKNVFTSPAKTIYGPEGLQF